MAKINKGELAKVRELLGLHPIKDATMPLRFFVLKADSENGVMQDPTHCALSLAVERVTGVKSVAVTFPTVMYVPEDKNGDGKFVIMRYAVRSRTRKLIDQFDKTGIFPPGEYTIFPPSKSATLESGKKRRAKAKMQRGKSKDTSQSLNKKAKIKASKEPTFLGLRNGTGRANIVRQNLIEASPIVREGLLSQ